MSAHINSRPQFALDQWNFLLGSPSCTGTIRVQPEDFKVEELLGFEPSGEGDHLWVNISKRCLNTVEVVSMISKAVGVRQQDVGFSGQKDRNAITSQWFSVPIGNDRDKLTETLEDFVSGHSQLELITLSAQPNKLKRGVHRANRFQIRVRNFSGDEAEMDLRLGTINRDGAPNYFGPQRFGRGGNNLNTAGSLFQGGKLKINRIARGMALSAARSWVFNQVLSERLARWNWNEPILGDAMQLDGNNAYFIHDGSDLSVVDRIARHDLHLTGPLWGQGEVPTKGEVAEFESKVVGNIPLLPEGLARFGMRQQRRALRLIPHELTWNFEQGNELRLEFVLPSGSFATALLREILIFNEQ